MIKILPTGVFIFAGEGEEDVDEKNRPTLAKPCFRQDGFLLFCDTNIEFVKCFLR